MSYVKIAIDFQNAINRASELENLAYSLKYTVNHDLADAKERLKKNWGGESADLFIRKTSDISDRLMSVSEQIKKNAEALRELAIRTRESEIRAYEIARRRDYNR